MHPEIDDEQVEGPVFVIGLPRTGHDGAEPAGGGRSPVPLAAAVGVLGPCPPPESATEHTDPRIADTEAGLAMMNQMFPLMAVDAPRGGDDGRPSARTCSA